MKIFEREPKPIKEKRSPKEVIGIFAAKTAIVGTMIFLVGGQLVDKINEEGIRPAIEQEGDQLESVLNDTVSKEDVETVIKVGCGLHNQMAIPTEEASEDPNGLTELCREYLPQEEVVVDQQVEVAQEETTFFVTTTTTTP
jgi:hypothetical protein